MENHDQAYRIWKAAGLRDRVLVHIDAHDDLMDHDQVRWTPEKASVNIATFLFHALSEGIVREICWVVPDSSWKPPANSSLVRVLKKITRSYHGCPMAVRVEDKAVSTTILHKSLRVCPLEHLPHFADRILLDIDVDFMFTSDHNPGALPWCWPFELAKKIEDCGLQADLVTIAFSVEGGFTPLRWKYLGHELAWRLGQPEDGLRGLQGMDLMREAALTAGRRDFAGAEEKYQEAARLLPVSAAPSFHLAHLYLEIGRINAAQECYRQALALDPSYRTPYNSGGLTYYAKQRLEEAEAEYRRTLTLDPEDSYAHFGLGRIAACRRDWSGAETHLKRSLALNGNLVDAYRTLGKVLARQGRNREAIGAYEKSLKLTLAGHHPLKRALVSDTGTHGLLDPDHFRTHARLARLYALEGETVRAINGYRLSIGGGYDGLFLRARLAYLYLKQRQWTSALREVGQAVKIVPADLATGGRRFWRRWQPALSRRLSWSQLLRRRP